MSAYLKRLNIADVDDTGEAVGAYTKRVHIVEVVDLDGVTWEPVPGPDPFDELIVLHPATWSSSNVYAVGEDIQGTSATYIGGTGNEIYRSRVQHKSATASEWTNTAWTEHLNVPTVIHFVIPAGEENGSVRYQTQARDTSLDPVVQKNSFASIKSIAPLQWGAISQTVDDNPYSSNDGAVPVAINSPIICSVSVANAPSDLSYEWSRRGSDNVLIGTPTAHQTAITFPEQGIFTVTVSLKSSKTAEWSSAIFTFMAS